MNLNTFRLLSGISPVCIVLSLLLMGSEYICAQSPELTIEQDVYQICEGETAIVQFYIDGEPAVWIVYEFDGVSSGEIPSSSNSFRLRLSEPGMYIVTAYGNANSPGAEVPDTFYIYEFPAPEIDFTGGGINCSDGNLAPLVANFTGEPNFRLLFLFNGVLDSLETGLTELTFLPDQSFTIEALSLEDNNCKRDVDETGNYILIEIPDPEIQGSSLVCAGETEIYYANETNYLVTWDIPLGGEYEEDSDEDGSFVTVHWMESGEYPVFLRYTEYEYACETEWEVLSVSILEMPEVSDIDTSICFELESALIIHLDTDSEDEVYWPELNITATNISLFDVGVYNHIHTNDANCSDTGYVRLISSCVPELHVPEAFTPNNGDALNDELVIYGLFDDLDFTIYSPSGIVLFHTNEEDLEYWDGTYKRKDLPAGSYYWAAFFSEGSSNRIEKTGVVTIIR